MYFSKERDSARSRLKRTNTEMAQCKMWDNVCCSKDFFFLTSCLGKPVSVDPGFLTLSSKMFTIPNII